MDCFATLATTSFGFELRRRNHALKRLHAVFHALAAHLLAALAVRIVVLGAFFRADLAGEDGRDLMTAVLPCVRRAATVLTA